MEGRATYPGRQFDQRYPNFAALLQRRYTLICVWVFDIMLQHGKDLRPLPLFDRRRKLDALMSRVRCDAIRHLEAFADPHRLLAACAARKLECIVQSEQMRRKRIETHQRTDSHTKTTATSASSFNRSRTPLSM